MISFYVWLYCSIGFGYFLGEGFLASSEEIKRFRVATSRTEEVATYIKSFVLCVFMWPIAAALKYRRDWWDER